VLTASYRIVATEVGQVRRLQGRLLGTAAASTIAADTATNNGKGKTVPLQAWSGPEGSRKLR
jgi:hypothetical protein